MDVYSLTTVSVVNNTGPTAKLQLLLSIQTCGASDGSINITGLQAEPHHIRILLNVPAGAGPYTAQLSHPNLPAGPYNIEVKDANGCLFFTTVTIIDNPGPTAITTTVVNSSCGAADGCVTITGVTGGTSPYMYFLLTEAHFRQLQIIAACWPELHNPVIVKDANGCLYK